LGQPGEDVPVLLQWLGAFGFALAGVAMLGAISLARLIQWTRLGDEGFPTAGRRLLWGVALSGALIIAAMLATVSVLVHGGPHVWPGVPDGTVHRSHGGA
jgi:hypothetical protein